MGADYGIFICVKLDVKEEKIVTKIPLKVNGEEVYYKNGQQVEDVVERTFLHWFFKDIEIPVDLFRLDAETCIRDYYIHGEKVALVGTVYYTKPITFMELPQLVGKFVQHLHDYYKIPLVGLENILIYDAPAF